MKKKTVHIQLRDSQEHPNKWYLLYLLLVSLTVLSPWGLGFLQQRWWRFNSFGLFLL